MNILIVEDDDQKYKHISSFLIESCEIKIKITRNKSLHSALDSITSNIFDLILLDMTLPTFDISVHEDGGRPQARAGREVLRQMKRRNINFPVIVITQFDVFGVGKDEITLDELNLQLMNSHHGTYLGAIYYSTYSDKWKKDLIDFLVGINKRCSND